MQYASDKRVSLSLPEVLLAVSGKNVASLAGQAVDISAALP